MIIPGLTSVTFRNKSPQEVIQFAKDAGLEGIEWGGDVHVPTGQIRQAEMVSQLTHDVGLKVNAYGSYYKVGISKNEGLRFKDVLNTAEVLGAPIIRIWAGNQGSDVATKEFQKKIIEETKEIADEAGSLGINLAFEFHENTINDTYNGSCDLLENINHPNVKTYWQPIHGAGSDVNASGIDQILPWIIGVHVFHWWPNHEIRLPLKDGIHDWTKYFTHLSNIQSKIYSNLEFIKDDSIDQFFKDAETLLELTGKRQGSIRIAIPRDN